MEVKPDFKNIIFDFGGVIIRIDPQRTLDAFRELGIKDIKEQYEKLKEDSFFDEFEKGMISPREFCNRIRNVSGLPLSDVEIEKAWNAILVDLPAGHIRFLEALKKRYRLFLLSNTNEIHEKAFRGMILEKFGEDVLKKIFDHVYLSHRLNLLKPDPEIFKYVLKNSNLIAEETLFVDDSAQHIEAAKKVGLQTFYFEEGKTLENIFKQ